MNEYAQKIQDDWGYPLGTTWEEQFLIEEQNFGGDLTPEGIVKRMGWFPVRERLVASYSWAVPTDEAVAAIAGFGSVIEWCAGLGYWSRLISDAGAQVEAFTDEPGVQAFGRETCMAQHREPWFEVQKTSGTEGAVMNAMRKSTAECLLLVWPPYDDPVAAHCLKYFKGQAVAYVGEWDGCTADEEFHLQLESEWEERELIGIPRWPGVRDSLFIRVRK